MRGTLKGILYSSSSLGITPAYAGNTLIFLETIVTIWDHPRVCGEHTPFSFENFIAAGSPPRMRGTLASFHAIVFLLGITPAYAGNTLQ